MEARVRVQLTPRGKWAEGMLTDERPELSYKMTVIVVDGETIARGPAEVYKLDVTTDANPDDIERRDFCLNASKYGYNLRRIPG